MMRSKVLCVLIPLAVLSSAGDARAVGEGVGGFPNWGERVLLEWTNRARTDPQLEMTACGAACGDRACYAPLPPYQWSEGANRAARFHSDEAKLQSYPGLDHASHCVVKSDIAMTYPTTCAGGVACAASQFGQRVSLFGVSPRYEIMASGSDPDGAFYQWLFESYPMVTAPGGCGYAQGPPTNGHRYALIDGTAAGADAIGFGDVAGQYPVGDLTSVGGTIPKIPSGAHYPRQAASVDAWANWYDTQAPTQALVNVDGTCTAMLKTRGLTAGNAAYKATLAGVGTGCHRYFFNFKAASGAIVTYPTTGSLGIGADGACADWDSTRPATGPGCNCVPQCSGKTCGDDRCGGSCGNCGASACSPAGTCVGGGGDAGARDGGGGDGGRAGGVLDDGGLAATGDGLPPGGGGGCGCRQGAPPSSPLTSALGSLFVLFLARARRRQRSDAACKRSPSASRAA